MRGINKVLGCASILAAVGLLMGSSCSGWPMGVNWFFAGTAFVLVAGALYELASH